MSEIRHLNRPGGETGIHEGLKIPWIHTPCGFESRPGHIKINNRIVKNKRFRFKIRNLKSKIENYSSGVV